MTAVPDLLKLSLIALDSTPTLPITAPQIKLNMTAYSMEVAPSSCFHSARNRVLSHMIFARQFSFRPACHSLSKGMSSKD